MAFMFQRGLSIGMANAASSPVQHIPPPSFPTYPYYQQISPQPQYNAYGDPAIGITNETSAPLPIQGNAYMPQPMGNQFQYPQGVSPYALPQFTPRQNSYQWPPSNVTGEMNSGSSGAVGDESH